MNGTHTYCLNEYKKSSDYIKSPFRYAGGKFYAIKQIMPFIDCVPHDEYREPFIGGGSVFFAKKRVMYDWINDLDNDLIEVYNCLSDGTMVEHLIEIYNQDVATKQRHCEIKEWKPQTLFDRVYRTYYLNRTSYCGIINNPAWGYKEGKSSPPQNWGKFLLEASAKLKNVKITSTDFSDVITAKSCGNSVLMYLDPPYYKADQKRAYTKSFAETDHVRLAKLLKETPYYFCLSYDDVDEVKEMYSWANIYKKRWLYNTANKRGENRDFGSELIITNYKVKSLTLFDN
jgi:DNA adenine methylase